jgi:AcrR family transcriptional regulator
MSRMEVMNVPPLSDHADTPARGRRADARRNINAILDAALTCLSRDPDVSIGEIAKTAGVGRVTLYGHFASRTELVDAVFARTIEQADGPTPSSTSPRSPWRLARLWRPAPSGPLLARPDAAM